MPSRFPWSIKAAMFVQEHAPWIVAQQLDNWIDGALRSFYEGRLAHTRPFECGKDAPHFELHMLLGRRHIGMGLWAIKSFLYFSGRHFNVVLHDDGSLGDTEAALVQRHLPGSRVIPRSAADAAMKDKLREFPACSEFRFSVVEVTNHRGQSYNMFIMALILLDMNLLSDAEKIMILDADVLFFSPPEEIVGWIANGLDKRSLYSVEKFRPYRKGGKLQFGLKPRETLNSGLLCFDRKRVMDVPTVERWMADNKDLMYTSPVFEQLAYSYLIRRQPDSVALPGNVYAFNYTDEQVVASHFGMKRGFFENICRIEDRLS